MMSIKASVFFLLMSCASAEKSGDFGNIEVSELMREFDYRQLQVSMSMGTTSHHSNIATTGEVETDSSNIKPVVTATGSPEDEATSDSTVDVTVEPKPEEPVVPVPASAPAIVDLPQDGGQPESPTEVEKPSTDASGGIEPTQNTFNDAPAAEDPVVAAKVTPEVKKEVKPEDKPEVKPEDKPEATPQVTSDGTTDITTEPVIDNANPSGQIGSTGGVGSITSTEEIATDNKPMAVGAVAGASIGAVCAVAGASYLMYKRRQDFTGDDALSQDLSNDSNV